MCMSLVYMHVHGITLIAFHDRNSKRIGIRMYTRIRMRACICIRIYIYINKYIYTYVNISYLFTSIRNCI